MAQTPTVIPGAGGVVVQGPIVGTSLSTSDNGPSQYPISAAPGAPVTTLTGGTKPFYSNPDGTVSFVVQGESGTYNLTSTSGTVTLKGTYAIAPVCWTSIGPLLTPPTLAGKVASFPLYGVKGQTLSWVCIRVNQ